MKHTFKLNAQFFKDKGASIIIIGNVRKGDEVRIGVAGADNVFIGWIEDEKTIETLALNILTALGKFQPHEGKNKKVHAKQLPLVSVQTNRHI
jgi:hypothetical protein